MAKIRKFCAYRRTKRPYTRISKYRKKAFIRTNPNIKITKNIVISIKASQPNSLNTTAHGNKNNTSTPNMIKTKAIM